jgi:hypothetical protein
LEEEQLWQLNVEQDDEITIGNASFALFSFLSVDCSSERNLRN